MNQSPLWKRLLLYLPSQLFGGVSWLRNKAFDFHLLAAKQFDIPTICIGNISVGGTGKTPHTEYVIRLLSAEKRLAVLSRGYKRKTSGFVLAKKALVSHSLNSLFINHNGNFLIHRIYTYLLFFLRHSKQCPHSTSTYLSLSSVHTGGFRPFFRLCRNRLFNTFLVK